MRFCVTIFFLAVYAQKTEGDVRSKKNYKFPDLRHIHLKIAGNSTHLIHFSNVFTYYRSGRT